MQVAIETVKLLLLVTSLPCHRPIVLNPLIVYHRGSPSGRIYHGSKTT